MIFIVLTQNRSPVTPPVLVKVVRIDHALPLLLLLVRVPLGRQVGYASFILTGQTGKVLFVGSLHLVLHLVLTHPLLTQELVHSSHLGSVHKLPSLSLISLPVILPLLVRPLLLPPPLKIILDSVVAGGSPLPLIIVSATAPPFPVVFLVLPQLCLPFIPVGAVLLLLGNLLRLLDLTVKLTFTSFIPPFP